LAFVSGRLSSGHGASPCCDFLARAGFGAIFVLELTAFLVGFTMAHPYSYKFDGSKVFKIPSSGIATHSGRLFNS
jgi:hypothetical protein